MAVSLCRRCGEQWPVLSDGTLVEHPQPENPSLLCTGSRTRPSAGVRPPRRQPATRPARANQRGDGALASGPGKGG
jgi:hypothetical protein